MLRIFVFCLYSGAVSNTLYKLLTSLVKLQKKSACIFLLKDRLLYFIGRSLRDVHCRVLVWFQKEYSVIFKSEYIKKERAPETAGKIARFL